MDKKKIEVVKETTSELKITAPFILAGKTYVPGDEKKLSQDAQKAYTAMLKRLENK